MLEQANFEQLVKQDKSLAQKVRDFFADFIDKIKKALQTMAQTNKEYRALQGDIEAKEQILAMFDEALKVSNQATKNTTDDIAVFVKYSNGDKDAMAVIEFDSSIDNEFIDATAGETEYHTVVTVFEPDVERYGVPFDYAEELLLNPNNFEL